MKKILASIILTSILLMSNVYAQYCIDNSTLYYTYNRSIGTDVYPIAKTTPCEFGCDNVTKTCREAKIQEYTNYFIIVVGILFIVLGLAYLSKRI